MFNKRQKHFIFQAGAMIALSLGLSFPTLSGEYVEIEHPNPQNPKRLQDSFKVHYKQDDFTDKVTNAEIIFAPADFKHQAGFFMRCGPYQSSFKVLYVDVVQNLQEDGELTNEAKKFDKFGFIYNAEQRLTVRVGDDEESFDVYVGGQTRHLTKHFKVNFPQEKGMLGMSFYLSFISSNTPVDTSRATSDEAAEFFEMLKKALKTGQPIAFELEAENGHKRHFVLDAERMSKAVPPEVLDFCFFERQLKRD